MAKKLLVLLFAAFLWIACDKEAEVSADTPKQGSDEQKTARENALAKETSPYLLQHKDNPVDWLPWGKEALAQAKKRDVPIIVSIGYSTCHWCHVMAHEVFENDDLAKMMNEWFVCIKIDREEHPAVDDIYMSALHAMGQNGGWPLNMFTTPDGKPFFGGTYFTPAQWQQILVQIHTIWTEKRDHIDNVAKELHQHLQLEPDYQQSEMPKTIWKDLDKMLVSGFDATHPAWSGPPKFPSSQQLRLVLACKREMVSATLKQQAVDILTTMQDSGLHDLVGGGFHRYSTDGLWRVPHFEKMLYDNALLAVAYCIAGQQYNRRDLAHTAMRTLDYLLRDARVVDKEGKFLGYASAEDADDPGGEGSFYAWSPTQLERVLGADIAKKLVKQWDISPGTPTKNHLGHTEPVVSHIPFPHGASLKGYPKSPESIELRLSWEQYYPKLVDERAKRPRPGLDSKVLTEWNGLALSAFAHASRLTGKQKYTQATAELAQIIIARHSDKGLLRLPHIPAFVNDYGFALCGLLDAYDALGDPQFIDAARRIADEAIAWLAHPQGGFYATAEDRDDLIRRSRILFDNAYPAGNSCMALGLVRLWNVTGEEKYQQYGKSAIEIVAKFASRAAYSLSTLLTAHLALQRGHLTIVVTGSGDKKEELLALARKTTVHGVAIVDVEKAKKHSWPVLEGRKEITEPTVLVCIGQRCLIPAKNAAEVVERLVELEEGLEQ